jgi:hypothetical protein
VQPTQLSLLPDHVPAPPTDLASQLPASLEAEAVQVLARLITQAVRATPALDTPTPHGCTQPAVSPSE